MTLPNTTWSTWSGRTPLFSSAPRAAHAPRSTALTSRSDPPKSPNGVRAPPRITRSCAPAPIPVILLVDDQRIDRVALQPLAALQKGQLDQEGGPDHRSSEALDEPERGRHRPPGGEQVVDGENALAPGDRVLVDREH